jgi:hypothetical protein
MGVLLDGNGLPVLCTLENPWLDNQTGISCIPTGEYLCQKVNSPKYKDVFEVKDVEGRTHILLHAGNTEKHTRGCILVGEKFGYLGSVPAVLNSKKTLNHFHDITGFNDFKLVIING